MKRLLFLIGFSAVLALTIRADGIPEPGIVLYGNVTNANRALRAGFLTVELTGPLGKVVRVTSQLNPAGPQAYRLRVPFESVVGGNTASAEAYVLEGRTVSLRLTAPAGYVANASTNRVPANFSLANAELSLPAGDRALVKEVNFLVAATLPSSGPARLAEARIRQVDDGRAGAASTPIFQFTAIAATEQPGILVEWSGAPVNRGYYLLRSTEMNATVEQSEVVRYFPPSAQTGNTFWDTNTVETTTYFYRLLTP